MNKRKIAAIILAGAMSILFTACGGESHNLEYIGGIPATCTGSGIRQHWRCIDCGALFLDGEGNQKLSSAEVPALGHNYSELVTTPSTCTEQGEALRVCRRCGDEENIELSVGGHLFHSYRTANATCIEEGKEERVCINCGKTEIIVIPVTAHVFNRNNECTSCGLHCIPSEGLIYSLVIENGLAAGYSVSGGTASGNIVIPYYYNTQPVIAIEDESFRGRDIKGFVSYAPLRSIGSRAFENCTSLSAIIFPDTLQKIGEYAFRGCTALAEIKIPDSVTEIGAYAFYACSQVESIHIGDKVSYLGRSAFYLMQNLKSITVAENNSTFSGEGNCLIERSSQALLLGSAQSIIPVGVESIGANAFLSCMGLKSIVIPSSVKSIGDFAFRDCIYLEEIVYEGTEAEWNVIPKGNQWNLYTSENFHVRFMK